MRFNEGNISLLCDCRFAVTQNNDEMLKSIHKVANKFDYILFDTAPVLDGVTTSLITKRCDGVVLVMAKEKTAYDVGLSAKEQIELAGGKILGVVLNNTRR